MMVLVNKSPTWPSHRQNSLPGGPRFPSPRVTYPQGCARPAREAITASPPLTTPGPLIPRQRSLGDPGPGTRGSSSAPRPSPSPGRSLGFRPSPGPWRATLTSLLALTLALPLLSGCAGAFIAAGVGAAVGATVVVRDRRGEQIVLADKEIEFRAKEWPGSNTQCQVAATSYNLVVLLTGQCQSEAAARSTVERIGKIHQVKQVMNEITIGPFASLQRQADDTLITSRLKLALVQIRLPDFDPTRVTIVTESGVVYLLGLVTPAEAEATVEKARYTPGVVKVVKMFETWNGESGSGASGVTASGAAAGQGPGATDGGRGTETRQALAAGGVAGRVTDDSDDAAF